MFEMIPVTSSNINAVGYDFKEEVLHVQFKGGKTYIYEGVPRHIYDELMMAESVGKYFNQTIKNEYTWTILI